MSQRKAFLLRIDPALWAELEAWAADELRSVNGQVEYLLREAVARRKRGNSAGASSGAASPGKSAENPQPVGSQNSSESL